MAFDKEGFIVEVREYMRDITTKNRLLDYKEESSADNIKRMIKKTIRECNGIQPLTVSVINEDSFDDDTIFYIMDGVVANLLVSESMSQERNRLDYQNNGGSYRVSDKAPMYLQISNMLKQEFKERMSALKRDIAFSEGTGGLRSVWYFTSYLV